MTDRIHALTVVLDRDIRDDDLEPIITAIRMIRHVADVQLHVADMGTHTAMVRIRAELYPKFLAALKEVLGA